MKRLTSSFAIGLFPILLIWVAPCVQTAYGEDVIVDEISAMEEAFTKAFNDGKVDLVTDMFMPGGELIDDAGNVYRGKKELSELFTNYFSNFPGANLALRIDSIRALGDNLAVEEGTRYLTTVDQSVAQVRYIATLAKENGKWRVASIREFFDEPAPDSGARLQSLAWLIGDWVSEGSDLAVRVNYRWDEDENFLIGSFHATRDGVVVLKTTQRVGWDPSWGNFRSWLFDSDGGFGSGRWTQVDSSWVIKSEATEPSGVVGTATVTITQLGDDRYQMVGTDRIIGDARADDFDVTFTRAPPKPSRASTSTQTGKPAVVPNSTTVDR